MENDFLDGIYWEKWYNKGNDPFNLPCDKDRVGIKGPCPIPLKVTFPQMISGITTVL